MKVKKVTLNCMKVKIDTFPDSFKQRLLGLPFSSIDTLSYRKDLVSTYTSDGSGHEGSGHEGPCKQSHKITKCSRSFEQKSLINKFSINTKQIYAERIMIPVDT